MFRQVRMTTVRTVGRTSWIGSESRVFDICGAKVDLQFMQPTSSVTLYKSHNP